MYKEAFIHPLRMDKGVVFAAAMDPELYSTSSRVS